MTHLGASYNVQEVAVLSKLHYIACAVPTILGKTSCIRFRVVMVASGDEWSFE